MEFEEIVVMLHFRTDSYLFDRSFRKNFTIYTGMGLSILVCFVFFLWFDFLVSKDRDYFKLVAVMVLSFGAIYALVSARKTFYWLNIRYVCSKSRITNIYMKETIEVSLENGFYVSMIPIAFAVGKGRTSKEFILISQNPILYSPNDYWGIKAIQFIFRNHAVLLPSDRDAIQWCIDIFQIRSIPSFPNVAHMPRQPSDLDY